MGGDNVSHMNTLGALPQSCGSLGCLAAILRPPEIAQNRKENEHVANLVFDVLPCDLGFFFARQSCGVSHNTVRLPRETQKFVVVDRCMAAARLL